LLEELGAGGMGVVYAAHDPELHRKVAIKLLRSARNDARLLREARALAQLSHPNIVAVYDVGQVEGRVFLAMELVEGTTLRGWLKERRREWREALEVFVPAGRGLAAAHAGGLVHRDFKPENVMLGHDGRVRVLDFGIVSSAGAEGARRADDEVAALARADLDHGLSQGTVRLTETGALIGTPFYMAPEQLRAEEIDERADQFSFCVALWEAVHGQRPFRGETLRDLVRAIEGGKPTEPTQPRPVPAWLRRLLGRGLEIDRAARHASMAALLAAIDAGLASEAAAARLVGRRYERLQQASGSASSSGERALDRLTGKLVTLVGITLAGDDESDGGRIGARLTLARAFGDLASLRHPNLVSVLDFAFDHDRAPYFVLDQRDSPTDLLATELRQPLTIQLDHLVQLLRALAYLHRHRVVFGALAPEAVLVTGNQVKLVPLGVAVDTGRARVAYAAPEIARGGAASAAADLYAFGVLAYEILASNHPFGGAPRGEIAPDLSAIEADAKVARVIGRLLEIDPSARYASAEEVIAALAVAAGQPFAADTLETRESRLQAAPLVGRGSEVERLHAAVRDACRGTGSAWLVGGESGIGKSRLLEEVRTLALVHGALVLRGQEEREGGSPYRLFRDALRWLALLTELDELEAGVLLPVVPDLAGLLGRPVTPAPELDAPSMHARLRDVVERILRRHEQPIVLLLEDLQWSRSDSLKLLQGISPLVGAIPLLILATYRDDERPGLSEELPGMEPITLSRLPEAAIAELAVAMIGEAGRRPEVLELLQRETEGNAFFVVEVVRALAEEAGGLEKIGAAALPDKVFAGGIQRVVQRRLRRVPDEARALLRTAAVIGRKIDRKLLESLAAEADLDAWIEQCVDATVVERAGEEHRFAHDKLREGLLAAMGDEERRGLHLTLARAIERLDAGALKRCAELAHHFGESGEAAKEAHYAALAGEQAVRGGAVPEGIRLLERALALESSSPLPRLERAHIFRLLGDAEYYAGNPDAASIRLTESLEILGYAPPRSALGWLLLISSQVLVQIAIRVTARRRARKWPENPWLLEASKAAGRMAITKTWMLDGVGGLGFSLLGVNLAERGGGADIFAMGVLGYAAGCLKLQGTAQHYFQRGRALALEENRPSDFVHIVYMWAMSHAGNGHIDASVTLIDDVLGMTNRIGDGLYTAMAEGGLGEIAGLRGHLDRRHEYWRTAVNRLDSSNGDHHVGYVLSMADALAVLGRLDEAERAIARIDQEISSSGRLVQSELYAVRARIHTYRGELDLARVAADESVRRFRSGAVVAALCYLIFEGVAEATFACWQRALDEGRPETAELARSGRRLLREAETWARIHAIGRPLMLLIRGRVRALSGAAKSARRAWLEAVQEARARKTPFYEAMAHFELGLASPRGATARREHLERARTLWSASNAAYHLTRLDAAESAEG
jgi:serine/threonine protein kinase/tetratricopeptide (TPR) repeat protein